MPCAEHAAQRCELRVAADLLTPLDERLIEYLTVDASRTFVCYREAVLDLTVRDGDLSAARVFTVGVQGFAYRAIDPDPTAVTTAFCHDLLAAIETVVQ